VLVAEGDEELHNVQPGLGVVRVEVKRRPAFVAGRALRLGQAAGAEVPVERLVGDVQVVVVPGVSHDHPRRIGRLALPAVEVVRANRVRLPPARLVEIAVDDDWRVGLEDLPVGKGLDYGRSAAARYGGACDQRQKHQGLAKASSHDGTPMSWESCLQHESTQMLRSGS
jgi:hypothetical protein